MSRKTRRVEDTQSKKGTSTFRKIKQYLEQQAQDQSRSALFLSPRTPWTQQEIDVTDSTISPYHPPIQHTLDPQSPLSTMTASSASGSGILQHIRRHQYASDNILQSYDVLVPPQEPSTRPWIIYIHGGYFRDPKVDSTSLKPAISLIEESPAHDKLRSQIGGYASLNYRLSPHPGHPQDPSSTPSYTLNAARWPNHIDDVIAALQHLQDHYPASRNYVLVGHSVGTTLAFLAVLRSAAANVAPPAAVVGTSGIYDFVSIHKTNPDYESLTKNAMTPEQYREASPALYAAEDYDQRWGLAHETMEDGLSKSNRVVLLAHSRDDGLVVWDQMDEMYGVLASSSKLQIARLELHGKHDEIWKNGAELVRAIKKVIEMLKL